MCGNLLQVRIKTQNKPISHFARDLLQLNGPSLIYSLALTVSYPVSPTHQKIYITLNPTIIVRNKSLEFIGHRHIKASDQLYKILGLGISAPLEP